jgi:hypothetical protein
MLERCERLGDRRAGGGGKAGRDQRVEYLEVAGQRQVDLVKFTAGDDLGALAETRPAAFAASMAGCDQRSSAKMTAGAPFGSRVSKRRSFARR